MHKSCASHNARVVQLTWQEYTKSLTDLAQQITDSRFAPDVIICVQRGGDQLAHDLSAIYNMPIHHISVLRTQTDTIRSQKTNPIAQHFGANEIISIRKQRVLIVDDIAGSGETLRYVKELLSAYQPKELKTAVWCTKEAPLKEQLVDFYTKKLEPDDWVVFPWERSRSFNHSYIALLKQLCNNEATLIKKHPVRVPGTSTKDLYINSDLSVHYENTLLVPAAFQSTSNILEAVARAFTSHEYVYSVQTKSFEDIYFSLPHDTTEQSLRIRKTYAQNGSKSIWCIATEGSSSHEHTLKNPPPSFSREHVRIISFNASQQLTTHDVLNIQSYIEAELRHNGARPNVSIQKTRYQFDVANPQPFNNERNAYPLMRVAVDHIEGLWLINCPKGQEALSVEHIGGANLIEIEINMVAGEDGITFAQNISEHLSRELHTISRPGRKKQWIEFFEKRHSAGTKPLTVRDISSNPMHSEKKLTALFQNNLQLLHS